MRSRAFQYPRRSAGASQDQSGQEQPESQKSRLRGVLARVMRGGLTVGLGLLLVPLSEADLFAQQAPPPAQEYSDYGQQQDSSQQQQPNYPQQQAYPQQPYPSQQQPNPQQQPYTPEQANPQQQEPMYPDEAQDYPPQGYGQAPASPNGGQDYPQPQYAPQQPLSAEQLQQMVAPIALYPDGLLAQVLAASTYPLQISEANQWRQAQGNAPPDQIAAGANMQNWDPSVKSLVAFPQVLAGMAQNLQWTTELGNAYYNQPQDVMSAVQTMRQRAMAAGTLENTPQETVTQDQGYVEVAPANPQIVYVPEYNPWAVYGQPVAPYPGFSAGAAFGSFAAGAVVGGLVAPVVFGVGMVMSAFAHMAWGFFGWGLGWGTGAVFFHGAGYCPHSWTVRDWGLAHGGPRYFGRFERAGSYDGRGGNYGRGGYARGGEYARGGYGNAYGRGGAAYGRTGVGQYGRGFAANRGTEGFRDGQYGGYGRNVQAYNHMPAFNSRSGYARPGEAYGAGNYGRSTGTYGSGSYGRSNTGYGSGIYGRPGVASGLNGRPGTTYGSGSYGRSGWATANRGFGMTGQQRMGSSFRGTVQPYRGSSYGGLSQSYRASAPGFRQPNFSGGGFGTRSSSHGFGGFSGGSGHSGSSFGGGHSGGFGGHSGGGHFGGGGGHFSHGGGSHFGGGGHGGGHHR